MAMKMRMQSVTRASSRAVVRCTASRRLAVSVNAHVSRDPSNFKTKVAPAVLAALISLTSGFTPLDILMPNSVHAEEQEDENLTPYERRQKDLAKRRELLKEAREKALLKASEVQETTTLEIDAKAPANAGQQSTAEEVKEAVQIKPIAVFQQRSASPPPVAAPAAPAPAPVEETKPVFSFSAPKAAPPPVVVVPPPAPAPVVVAPQKVAAPAPSPAKAPEQKAAVSKKRRGPLPTFLAELLVLGFYAGFFTAITKYNAEAGQAVNTAKAAIVSLYEKVEKAVPADFK